MEEQKSEEESKEKGEEGKEDLNLFKASGIQNPENWQCIWYIAPTAEKKSCKSTEAIGVYCMACKSEVKYHSTKNPKGIKRHMERTHSDLLEKYTAANADLSKKRKSDHGIDSFFPKKPKTDKMANRVNHEQFHRLIALWSGLSLRPFSICEDALLQEAFMFATGVSGNLSLPSRNTNRKNILRVASQMKKSIKHNIQLNCTYFS